MNAAVNMETCPPEEILAAFIDERLDAKSRLEVVRHLADCGDCRDIVVAANEYENMNVAEEGNDNVVRVAAGRFGVSKFVPVFAAAAIMAVLFAVPSNRERLLGPSSMDQLVEAANTLPKRPSPGRLSGDFVYKVHSNLRGSEEERAEFRIEAAAAKIEDRALESPNAKNLHESGVANIVLKRRDEAVTALENATKENPSSAEIWTDLSAAYLARARDDDYQRALSAATKAWEIRQTPAAAWNRALALELLRRDAAAITAWQAYLRLDSGSEWATEARNRVRRLQEH